jgi:hypothetical protein
MAALARAVEADLQTLSQEARRSLPAVKESAERVLLDIRSARGGAGPAVDIAADRVQALKAQWLHPFMLACNHAACPKKLLVLSLAAIQRLLSLDAVAPGDAVNIVRVLEIQVRCMAGRAALARGPCA